MSKTIKALSAVKKPQVHQKVLKQTELWADKAQQNVKDVADTMCSMTRFIIKKGLYAEYLDWDLNQDIV